MAYDLHRLFDEVDFLLDKNPCTTLFEISRQLAVDRHTIEKVVRLKSKKSFRDLRREYLYARACSLLSERPERPLKQVASSLGYTTVQALYRFILRNSGMGPTNLRRVLGLKGSDQSPFLQILQTKPAKSV
jgi:AraC-like DNA-binding protein